MQTDATTLDAFRAEISQWLINNIPEDPGFLLPQSFMEVGSEEQLEFLIAWQKKVYEAGYLGMAWPKEYGGGGMPQVYQNIVDEELMNHKAPIIFNVIGLGWAGPLILDMGTEEEKQRYIKGILTADDIWCQGFSEPDHGSDLGNAQTRAVRDGDDYIINGSKIWTTFGNYAKYMILLARTNPDAPSKYAGLSFFLSPMHADGISTSPIQKITGEYGFCQTFFDDARIPASCLMGEENQGWKVAMRTLEYERSVHGGQASTYKFLPIAMEDLLHTCKTIQRDGKPLLDDPVVQDQLVQFLIEEKSLALMKERGEIPELCTDYPFSLALSGKLIATELFRRARQYAVSLQGAKGGLYVGDNMAIEGGQWQRGYFNNFSATIGGGTSQVQANIIAEHALGLPK
ncbi:acyl-CoA dehydrogenase family protein [uncultured Pseudoteredinibacter sp.]|uniref:acyl-CoA dehydrogenase family protein n=1 Tax=uncultured Pseudoteredinibacter sp. TaxID=1641701 RepID=UPI00262195D1|nr:acyl-CoA dehydrogenase family protein [uncultured Pseudoteredinibacter sp.]